MEQHITFETAKLAKEKQYIDGEKPIEPFEKLGLTNCSPSYN